MVGVEGMAVFFLLLTVFWFWAVCAFARWRLCHLKRGAEGEINIANDWAVQLLLKGTGLVLVAILLLVLRRCS